MGHRLTGPAIITLAFPVTGVEAVFNWADDGFGEFGYDIQIVKKKTLVIDSTSGAIPVEVTSYVPSSQPIAIEVEAVHDKKDGKKLRTDLRKGMTGQNVLVTAKLKA